MNDAAKLVRQQPPSLGARRASERRYERRKNQENWLTFGPDPSGGVSGFATLQNISEARWGPEANGRSPRPHAPTEMITYVRAGRLTRCDSAGQQAILHAGEFERTLVEPHDLCTETNPSPTHFAHVFRILLCPAQPLIALDFERKQFSETERKQRMLLVASRSGDNGSLRISQDVSVFSTLLYPGQRVAHQLQPGRSAWLHVVHGSVSFGKLSLAKGDGVGVARNAVSVTARQHAEILVVDVADSHGVPGPQGGVA